MTAACLAAGISTSSFYEWDGVGRHGPSRRDLDDAYLVNEIVGRHDDSGGTYGVPRITAQLRHDGHRVNHKRVERLMAEHGIYGVFKPRKVRTTIPAEDNPPIPDLLKRGFAPGCPNQAFVGDIT